MKKDKIQQAVKDLPGPLNLTEEDLKDNIYICLKCFNTWNQEGFSIKLKNLSYTCRKCNKETSFNFNLHVK